MTRARRILQSAERYDFHHPAVQVSKAIMAKHPEKNIAPHKHPHKKGKGI